MPIAVSGIIAKDGIYHVRFLLHLNVANQQAAGQFLFLKNYDTSTPVNLDIL